MTAGADGAAEAVLGVPATGDVAVDHPLRPLRDIVRRARRSATSERCDMCSADIAPDHRHVVDVADRSLRCLCTPCHLLFSDPAAAEGRYRQVPHRYRRLSGVEVTGADWDRLQIPVGLAFFLRSSASDRPVCFYPGPAGATESLLPLEQWERLVDRYPELTGAEVDVEAVLLRRTDRGTDCYLVPVDTCYELVGRLRTHWVGFDGGAEVRAELGTFFAGLEDRTGA